MDMGSDDKNSKGLWDFLDRHHLWMFFLIALVSRLPLWLAPQSILNGDESILALMAKHMSEGKEFPLYFYGQQYGLSIFETASIAGFYKVLGVHDLVYRLALLSIWILGVHFFYRAIKHQGFHNTAKGFAWLLSVALILSPAWFRLSYVSPFMLTCGFFYAVLHPDKRNVHYIMAGILFAFIVECQRLWLPPLLLFTLAMIIRQWTWKQFMAALIPGAMISIGLLLYKMDLHDAWHPQVIDLENLDAEKMDKVPGQVWNSLNGHYYLFDTYDAPLWVKLSTGGFLATLFLSIAVVVWSGFRRSEMDWRSWALIAGLIGIPLYIAVSRMESLRYLLPFSQFAFLLLGLVLWRLGRKFYQPVLILLVLISIGASYQWKDFSFYTVSKIDLAQVEHELEERGIKYVFCNEPLAQWQLMYDSREEVICRFHGNTDRYPAYVSAVNEDFKARGSATLVARKWKVQQLEPDFICEDGQFAIFYALNAEQLKEAGFELED